MASAAELIVTNATVYTAEAARPWATDLAIGSGVLLAVGDRADVAAYRGDRTEVRDLAGAFVLPGLVDVHNHHQLAGRAELFELTVSVTAGFEQVLAAVRDWAARLGPEDWVVGGGWGSTLVETLSEESARHALDDAAGGRPVLLADDSRHNRLGVPVRQVGQPRLGPGVRPHPLELALSIHAGLGVGACLQKESAPDLGR